MTIDQRMKWGFDNPNDAAAFWTLVLLALPVPHWRGRPGLAVATLAIAASAVLLALVLSTASRGACAALLAAAALRFGLPLAQRLRVRPAARLSPAPTGVALPVALACLAVFAAAAALTPLGTRLSQGLRGTDPSVAVRASILRDVPAMVTAAPGGWGTGQAAQAWQNWFEPVGDHENLRHLLSSHSTWLVEWPWAARLAYLFAWASLFVFALPPQPGTPAQALAFSTAAFVLGLCNHVFAHPAVLAAFAVGAAAVLSRQWMGSLDSMDPGTHHDSAGRRLCVRRLGIAAVVTLATALSLVAVGRSSASSLPIRKEGAWIVAGNPAQPAIVVPWIDPAVFGQKFGHAARSFLGGQTRVACLAARVPGSPATATTAPHPTPTPVAWIVAGGQARGHQDYPAAFASLAARFPDCRRKPLVWLNPPDTAKGGIPAILAPLDSLCPSPAVIGWGEWRKDASPAPWRRACADPAFPARRFSILPGTANYVAAPFSRSAALLAAHGPDTPTTFSPGKDQGKHNP